MVNQLFFAFCKFTSLFIFCKSTVCFTFCLVVKFDVLFYNLILEICLFTFCKSAISFVFAAPASGIFHFSAQGGGRTADTAGKITLKLWLKN